MLAQNMLKQYFDASKLLKKGCTTVLLNHSRWEEQHDNKLISPQEVKLRCGIRDVNIMWGPDSKSYNLFDKQAIFIPMPPRLRLMDFVQIFSTRAKAQNWSVSAHWS